MGTAALPNKKNCNIKGLMRHKCAFHAQFLTSYPQIHLQGYQGGAAWDTDLVLEQNCALKRIFSNRNSIQNLSIILTGWARAREYRDGEAGYLQERAWHLIPTCESASLQLRGTVAGEN